MKKILLSLAIILAVGGIVWGATVAFYNDTETSSNNVFTAGSIDLKVDHTYASYDGVGCVGTCSETGNQLVTNGGFETPALSNGQWQVYPDGTQTSWNVIDGAGLEIQNHAAGNPHLGNQLAELDSNGADSQTTIAQVINTVPGQQYRLSFWHSARPGNNAGDNQTRFTVKVTSTDGVMVNQTVYEGPIPANQQTQWTEYTYNFIALNNQTTIQFADAGNQEDTYGGYIDDVSLKALNCPQGASFPNGGICTVWGERDLGKGDTFWNFGDIKPGDYGTNVLSLHDYGNDAYACLLPSNIQDDENTATEPELTDPNETTDNGIQNGELSDELEFFMWKDVNGNNVYNSGEEILVDSGTPFNLISTQMTRISLVANDPISLIGISWCAGDQTGPTDASPSTTLSCDGNGMGDIAQTDMMIADFVAYATQQRNNSGFTCADTGIIPFAPAETQ